MKNHSYSVDTGKKYKTATGRRTDAVAYFAAAVLMTVYVICMSGSREADWFLAVMNAVAVIVLASAGQTFVLLIRGVDLSVAGVMSFVGCMAARLMPHNGLGMAGLCIGLLFIGASAGFLNGYIITRFKLQSFIVTFASWFIWGGLAYCVLPQKAELSASEFARAVSGSIGIIPVSVLVMLGVCLLWVYLRRTYFGVSLYAVEHNRKTAYYSGINVNGISVAAYTLCGFFAALAGIYNTAVMRTGDPKSGDSYILLTLCAALLGGADTMGGRGGIFGTVAGCFILQLFVEMMLIIGVPIYWAQLMRGILFTGIIAISTAFRLSDKNR